jgi:tetratricopeptide (TPR) repeat protein
MNKATCCVFLGLLPLLFFLQGCSTGWIAVDFRTTEGYVDRGKIEVYLSDITGESAEEFRKELADALYSNGRFLPQQYGKLPPVLPDSMISIPSIIITGHHDTHEQTNTYTEKSGEKEKKIEEITDIDEFHYSILDGTTVQEMDQGTVQYISVSKQEKKETSFLGSIFGGIVKTIGENLLGIKSHRRGQTINDLVASLMAHTSIRRISFYEDDDLPELEEGAHLIAKGNYAGAISKFQMATEKYPSSESVYKAYYNLGVVFEYDYQFEKALVSLRIADELHPAENFKQEMAYCEFFARRYDWQYRFLQHEARDHKGSGR